MPKVGAKPCDHNTHTVNGKCSGCGVARIIGHDPLVCGADRVIDCPACLDRRLELSNLHGSKHAAALDRWEKLCRSFTGLRGVGNKNPCFTPKPLSLSQLGRVLFTLLQPECGNVLRQFLMGILAEPIGQLVAEMVIELKESENASSRSKKPITKRKSGNRFRRKGKG